MPELTYLEARGAAVQACGKLADLTIRRGGLPGGFFVRPDSYKVVRRGSEWFAIARVEVFLGEVHVATTGPEASAS